MWGLGYMFRVGTFEGCGTVWKDGARSRRVRTLETIKGFIEHWVEPVKLGDGYSMIFYNLPPAGANRLLGS